MVFSTGERQADAMASGPTARLFLRLAEGPADLQMDFNG